MRGWIGVACVALAGCTSVKVVQRDGCWVRQTDGFLKVHKEEIGPCARRQPKWSDDRVARLAQECMAEADYRWETAALAAWNSGQPLPAQESEQAVMRSCMNDAATSAITENERLHKRLDELTNDRETLRQSAGQDLEHLRQSQDRMTDALGEAAKKPAPSAYATSTSSGTATTESEQNAHPSVPVDVSASVPLPSSPPHRAPKPKATRNVCDKHPSSSGKTGADNACVPFPSSMPLAPEAR